jgi:hypothetical protein
MIPTKPKIALALVLGASLLVVGGRVLAADDDLPKSITENKNTLVKTHKEKLKVTASTFFGGYEPEKVLDGDVKTSWFSASGDSVGKGKKPWLTITFPEDVTVTRVSIAGNRDPAYPKNYSVLTGTLEFLDVDGKSLWKEEQDGVGKAYDFEFKPKQAVKKVRAIKFVSVKDEGDKNGFGDVALGEFLIE